MIRINRSRRRFLLAGSAVGGGLLIGYGASRPRELLGSASILPTATDEVALNAWLKIASDGTVTVAVPRAEMGQGVYTALSMLVAEELDVPWPQVKCIQAPVDKIYGNVVMLAVSTPFDPEDHGIVAEGARWTFARLARVLGIQATGGSSSVRDGWITMRAAGAAARDMLLRAGAARMVVKPDDCVAQDGVVRHAASGRTISYGELATEAARLTPPTQFNYKKAADYKLIGKAIPRLDIPEKVIGSTQYAIDVRPPGIVYAAVKASPVFGGKVKSFDSAAALTHTGVITALAIDDAVIVIADNYWQAHQALAATEIDFDEGANADFDMTALRALYADAFEDSGRAYEDIGDAMSKIDTATSIASAEFEAPLLAHACMEPINCTVLVTDTHCEIWSGNQAPTLFRDLASDLTGLSKANITLHTMLMGGGFGRRAEIGILHQAIPAAKAVPGRPLQLIWSREEDMRQDVYRPPAMARFKAVLTEDGQINAWSNRIVSPSVTKALLKRTFPSLPAGGPDKTNAEGATFLPYRVANRRVEHIGVELPIPVGYWRSVGHSFNAFFTECFIDELAAAANQDPIEFRLAHLSGRPRETHLLRMLAQHSGWGSPLASNRARGVALHESFNSIVGQVAEIEIIDKSIKVHRVVCVVDCGLAIHPDNVVAQMESGIIFGLTAALFGEITVSHGRIEQANFPDYPMVKLADSPTIETHIINSGAPLGGIGEPGTPPIAPAVANAVSTLTGTRVRKLPIRL